jgi:DNA ligase-1
MRMFGELIDTLIYTRSRDSKVRAIANYLRVTPDPDRGWALAALTESLDFPAVKSATIRKLAGTRIDPELFRLSRHYVGDTAETVALIWPDRGVSTRADPSVSDIVAALSATTRSNALQVVGDILDSLDVNSRYAMLKLATGGMRIGVSARLAKVAFAQAFNVSPEAVEEYWHAVQPPYT